MTATRPADVHVAMMVHNTVVRDSRVRKEAAALAAAGYRVTVLAAAGEGALPVEGLDGAVIVRVPVPHRLQDELRARRARWRSRRIPLLSYRDDEHRAAARLRHQLRTREAGGGARRLWLGAEGFAIRARGSVTHQYARVVGGLWTRLDRRLQQIEAGSRWRRVLPGLQDYELAFGPALDRLQPDVIHAHDVQVLGIAVRAARRARAAGADVKVVYDSHEFVPGLPKYAGRTPKYAAAFENLEAEYVRDADRVVTVSPVIAAELRKHYRLPREPAVVLNTPAPAEPAAGTPRLRDVAGVGEDTLLLVYSGGLTQVRGVNVAIDALRHLPEAHLAVVCVPNNRTAFVQRLRHETAEAGLSERVHFVDPVPPDQVTAYLASADVGVHPLLGGILNHELALPNKLFEYLHAGLPVAVSDLRQLGRFVREHGTGEAFPSGDAEGLAAAVRRILDDPRPYREAAADPALRAEYSWDRQADVLRETYADLLGVAAGSTTTASAAAAATASTSGSTDDRDAESAAARVLIGPFNMAGQGWTWARALERFAPGVRASALMIGDRPFPADVRAPEQTYRDDLAWQVGQVRRMLSETTHVLAESARPVAGPLLGQSFVGEAAALRAGGVQVGLILHGSEARDPRRHRELVPHSIFNDPDHPETARLQKNVDDVMAQVADFDGPVWVASPDLPDFVPDATWLPFVVDVDALTSSAPVLERPRPVVLFAPTNGWLKGAGVIDPELQRLHDAGLIEYRRLEGVPHAELTGLMRSCDIVVDQVQLGLYGVTAAEAMAAGRVTVAHVPQRVRDRLPGTLPIVEAGPADIGAVIERLVSERDEGVKAAAAGAEYARTYHDGREAARLLLSFL